MTPTPIPADILRAIYQQEQPHRVDWPREYAVGMSDPLISRIVEMLARHRVPAYRRQDADRFRAGVWSTSPGGRGAHRADPSPIIDGKSAAAGERLECPACGGSGMVTGAYTGGSFDGSTVQNVCFECNGTGFARSR